MQCSRACRLGFADKGYALANLWDRAVNRAFYKMQAPWTAELCGLNVTLHLGAFFGEPLIQKQLRLH